MRINREKKRGKERKRDRQTQRVGEKEIYMRTITTNKI